MRKGIMVYITVYLILYQYSMLSKSNCDNMEQSEK